MKREEEKAYTLLKGLLGSGNEQFKSEGENERKLSKEQKIFVWFALVVLAVFLIFQIIEFLVFVWTIMQ